MTDREKLLKAGWKMIGHKRGPHGGWDCWIPPHDSVAAEDPRPYWTQDDALDELVRAKRAGVLPA
jgi:hypothetical protein